MKKLMPGKGSLMTLHITGRISLQDSKCEKCDSTIQVWKKTDSIKCKHCGALYEITSTDISSENLSFTYDFISFKCVHSDISGPCENSCPAPGMYCKEHVSDKSFKGAKDSIKYAEVRLQDAKDTLERMEESKKTWLIQEVSGLDEQDDAVQTGKNR